MQAVCECSWGGEEVLPVCMLFPRPPWARPALPHVDVMQPSGGPLGTRISVLLFLSVFASPEPHCAYTPLLLPSTLYVLCPASPVSLATVLRGHLKAALFLTCCRSTWLRKASPTLSVAIWLLIKRSHFITAWFQFWSLNLWTLFTLHIVALHLKLFIYIHTHIQLCLDLQHSPVTSLVFSYHSNTQHCDFLNTW